MRLLALPLLLAAAVAAAQRPPPELPAADVIARRLAGPQVDAWDLVALATMGAGGRSAAPAVLRLLEHPDADTRASAAMALGYLDYPAAIPALRAALVDPRDVRLAIAAAKSLGLLHAEAARADLGAVAAGHWYPPVRTIAAQALATIDAGLPPVIPDDPGERQRWEWTISAVDNGIAPIESCARTDIAIAAADPNVVLRADVPEHEAALAALAFDSVVLSHGPSDAEEQRAAAEARGEETPIIVMTKENMVEHRTTVREEPVVALRVPGGWLAGSNRGEWGGELMFLADDGSAPVQVQVHDDNIHALFPLGGRFVALTGLAHMRLNKGAVLTVERGADGHWQATPWRILPGAPSGSELTTGGELLIDTRHGGTLLLAADGTMRMAPCAAVAPDGQLRDARNGKRGTRNEEQVETDAAP